MTGWRLTKDSLLRRGDEFQEVYSGGRRLHGSGFTLVVLPREGQQNRLGISVQRKIRGAVRRNRIKRIVRESFRLARTSYPPGADVVFVVRPDFRCCCPAEVTQAVQSLRW